MVKFLLHRILIAVPTLVFASLVAFFLVQLMPGNPGEVILGLNASPEQVAQMNNLLGVDQPFFEQMFSWFGGLLHGDLGESLFSSQPVTSMLMARAPVTISLAVAATALVALTGIGLGVLAALRGGVVDRVVVSASTGAAAVPNFWLGLLLVLAFAIWIPLFPAVGYTSFGESPSSWARGLVLPVIAIALSGIAQVARQTRSAMLEVLSKDYIRTLRAAGISNRSIVFRHALRNAAVTVVPAIGIQFIGILSGAVIVEQVFAMPGIGQLTLSAVQRHDYPVIQGVVLFATVLVILANLTVDLINYFLNPRLGDR